MNKLLLTTCKFSVEERSYPGADGSPIVRQVVIHPGAVVVLPLLDERRIVMIHNYRYSVDEELLELPAGTIDPGEHPANTAVRELEEETGYRAARFALLARFYSSPGITNELMHAFIANDLRHVGAHPEDTERIRVEVLPLDTVRDLLRQGRIRDGKTIATLGTFFAQRADAER